MSPVAITLLMLAGFVVFAALAWRKLAIVAALAPDDRFNDVGARVRRLIAMGFGQSRLLSGDFGPA